MNTKMLMASIIVATAMSASVIYAMDFPAAMKGTADKPLILLELGKQPASANDKSLTNVKIYPGDVSSHMGDDYVSVENDEIISGKKDFNEWIINFQFKLDPKLKAGDYTFFARWNQGGEAAACPQTFAVYAGPDASNLEERGSFKITFNTAWQYEWLTGGALKIKDTDAVVEIRNSGNGHDAKVFDSFALLQK